MPAPRHIRLGSRGSALALWQTEHVAAQLHALYPDLTIETVVIHTKGDRVVDRPLPSIGGKGLFTLELENALREGGIDGVVHSLKDLPIAGPAGLTLGAIPARGDVADALIMRAGGEPPTAMAEAEDSAEERLHAPLLERGESTPRLRPNHLALREGATVGTSSRRRAAQLLAQRPDLQILDMRGNVETRIRKTLDPGGPYDAAILAAAGLKRLGLDAFISATLPLEQMLPAPGQGALAVQCRQEAEWLALFGGIDDRDTRAAVTAERSFLAGLGGGCHAPIAALAECEEDALHCSGVKEVACASARRGGGRSLRLWGRVSALDGSRRIDARLSGPYSEAERLGRDLAQLALRQGAQEILDRIAHSEESPEAKRQSY